MVNVAQARAAHAVNSELVTLYWTIGHEILEAQATGGWGDDIVGRIADDLRVQTHGKRGFSRRNVFYMRRFAMLWPAFEKVQSPIAQIGWTHQITLMDRLGGQLDTYRWYAAKAAERGWSVRVLQAQIANEVHLREGAAVTNFSKALESVEAERVLAATKDPYFFDFLTVRDEALEKEVEQGLIDDIQAFLIELGRGFAFYGRQQAITVDGTEYFMDLIFYHHSLRRFVVIELKIGDFHPSYVGTMNFYLNAVDQQFRVGDDRESVGIILCASRNHTVAELALHGVEAPIAVSTWRGGEAKQLEPGTGNTKDAELAELEDVRSRLIQRVDQHVNRPSTGPNSEDTPGPIT